MLTWKSVLTTWIQRPENTRMPPEIIADSYADTARQALLEVVSQRQLVHFLDLMNLHKIPCLVLKGSALAYSLYPEPWLRPRLDNDIWISKESLESLVQVLTASGYKKIPSNHGTLVHTQMTYFSTDPQGRDHFFDIHWQILNPVRFRSVLNFSEAWSESLAVPALHPAARTLSHRHHLLLCCCHWVGHHFLSPSPIWESDIELLSKNQSTEWWASVTALFIERKVACIGAAALEFCKDSKGIEIPSFVFKKLQEISDEPANYFLRPDRNRWRDLLHDISSFPDYRSKIKLLKEHLFPSAEYISTLTGSNSRSRFFIFYFLRIFKGFKKLGSVTRP